MELLTRGNWQEAVVEAIQELPDDLQSSVGHARTSEYSMKVIVAGHPMSGDQESHVSTVKIVYWKSVREQGWPA